jgi:hypothetical protein
MEAIDGKLQFGLFGQCVKDVVELKDATDPAGVNVMAPDIAKAMGG